MMRCSFYTHAANNTAFVAPGFCHHPVINERQVGDNFPCSYPIASLPPFLPLSLSTMCVEERPTGRTAQCTKVPSGPFSERSNEMARKKSSRTQSNPDQLNLFALKTGAEVVEIPTAPPVKKDKMDIKQTVRKWLSAEIKRSGKSREDIAFLVSAWTNTTVTKDQLDMWTKESHPSDMPAHYLPAFTVIFGSDFLDLFAQKAGCRIAGTKQLALAQVGQMVVIQKMADRKIQEVIADLPLMQAGG